MKGNCETCRHWETLTSTRENWGDCEHASAYRTNPIHGESLAVAWSYGGDEAGLYTHATFGCVQWEGKA